MIKFKEDTLPEVDEELYVKLSDVRSEIVRQYHVHRDDLQLALNAKNNVSFAKHMIAIITDSLRNLESVGK